MTSQTSTADAPSKSRRALAIGSPQHFRWLKGIIATVFVFNVLDGLLTIYWIVTGQATEANPLMEEVLDISPALFMAVKLGLVGLGSILLWRTRDSPVAVVSVFLLFMVYYFLLLYHLQHMNIGLFGL